MAAASHSRSPAADTPAGAQCRALLGIAGFAVAGVLGIAWAALALKSGKL